MDVETASTGQTVCVTGATGYLASHIVYRLLVAGCKVRGTVRSVQKAKFLTSFPNAPTNLSLFVADLTKPGSFDEAVSGSDIVIHVASPFISSIPKGKEREYLIDPAVKGTENVIASVEKTPSVTRVVLTSSMAAIYVDPYERGKGHLIGPSDWNLNSTETAFPYYESKKLAEQRAWELNKLQSRWSLVSINPAGIFGPPLTDRTDGESMNLFLMITSGKMWPAAPPYGLGVVDVRDAAAAHVRAAFTPTASGRYVTSAEEDYFVVRLGQVVEKLFPGKFWTPKYQMPYWLLMLVGPYVGLPRELTRALYGKIPKYDKSRILADLGFGAAPFITLEESVKDTVKAMVEFGLLKLPK